MNSSWRDRFLLLGCLFATPWATALGCSASDASSTTDEAAASLTQLVSPDVVISQVYGGGGNSGAPFANDYVELFNRGASAVSVSGWSVQYASATGSSWAKANLTGTIGAGRYYLVALAGGGAGGATLPTADATGTMNMSGTSGTVALVSNQTLLSCGGSTGQCLPNANVHDFVGYGSAQQFEGSGAAPTLSTSTAAFRGGGGCADTDDNAADFSSLAAAPRNASASHGACGGTPDAGTPDTGTPDTGTPDTGAPDSGTPDTGSGGDDGTPTRRACTNSFGSAMSTTFGRLDGFLVAIVNPGQSSCSGDAHHVHLQILMHNAVYNIAVDVDSNQGTPDVDFLTLAHALQGGAWSEGWHPQQQLDYANDLGVHSGDFAVTTPSQLTSEVISALATVNHVSIFTTGFSSQGGHLVHREGSSHDGAIVIDPLSSSPQYLLFHFANQTF